MLQRPRIVDPKGDFIAGLFQVKDQPHVCQAKLKEQFSLLACLLAPTLVHLSRQLKSDPETQLITPP
jgi:hypothetical protein